MASLKKHLRLPEVKRQILRLFTDCNIEKLSPVESEKVQKVMSSLINPPALSRLLPKPEEYQETLAILEKCPKKSSAPLGKSKQETDFGPAEISLVLQGLDDLPDTGREGALKARMYTILRNMTQGNNTAWKQISTSTEPNDIAVYSFLKESLLRAKSLDSFRLEQAPKKRSIKKFWDGGVNI